MLRKPYWLLLFLMSTIFIMGSGTAVASVPLDEPEQVVAVGARSWVVDAGFVYYGTNCFSAEFNFDATLGRKATTGSYASTIGNIQDDTTYCGTYAGLDADEDGVYYYDYHNDFVAKRDTGNPTVEVILADVPIAGGFSYTQGFRNVSASADHVYWFGDDNGIWRVSKEGGTPEKFLNVGSEGNDLEVIGNTLYYAKETGLTYASLDCTPLPCTDLQGIDVGDPDVFGIRTNVSSITQGTPSLFIGNFTLYYTTEDRVSGEPGSDVYLTYDTIGRYQCNTIFFPTYQVSCGTTTLYSVDTDHYISKVSEGGGYLFWEEYDPDAGETRIYRMPTSGGTPEAIHIQPGLFFYGTTYTDNIGVYFRDRDLGISRLPFDASPIVREFAVDDWEITQAVQDLNEDVPLIADKPTIVRVYGSMVQGPRANGVQAVLHGTRNGNPLPRSPLTSVNGTESFNGSYTPDRANANDGWMFELPSSWDDAGSIVLELEIDPGDAFDANMTSSETATFQTEPAACVVYMPVRTHDPLPNYSSPHVWTMIDRYTQLWPIPETRTYWQGSAVEETEACWWGPFPYPCGGPFELDTGASAADWFPDKDEAITYIIARGIFSDDPDECDADGGSVHYIGMVHGDASTGGIAGYANTVNLDLMNGSWVQNPSTSSTFGTDWDEPFEGGVLAQELGHNLGRKHVDCGNPSNIDNNYPYPGCQISDVGASSHYGFDTTTNTPIEPNAATDFMSYGGNYWVSDYTYKALMGEFGLMAQRTADKLSTAAQELSQAATYVTLSGAVDPTQELGMISYVYQFESASTSRGVMDKMQSIAAGKWDAALAARANSPVLSGPLSPLVGVAANYHLQLLTADGTVLEDRMIEFLELDNHGEVNQAQPFLMSFPAPAGEVAEVRLLGDGTVLDSHRPGTAAPTISITSPDGSSAADTPFVITWTADDPDPDDLLLFNISYSPDNGAHWTNLTTEYIGDPTATNQQLTLDDPLALSGSNGVNALIRIVASDGYNSTEAVSAPFAVPNRAPVPGITSPGEGQAYPAGSSIPLRGMALDAEDGKAESFTWEVDGQWVSGDKMGSAAGLAPGAHTVRLTATDADGSASSVDASFQITPLSIPSVVGFAPNLDGGCDDALYDSALVMPLKPYSDGSHATAYLLRDSNYLHVCFTGLTAGFSSKAGIRIDTTADGGATPQSDDYAFMVDSIGTPADSGGDGSTFTLDNAPGGYAARMINDNSGQWSAEMRIEAATLGGWDNEMNMMVEHTYTTITLNPIGSSTSLFAWPYAAESNTPDTWGATAMGSVPQVAGVSPTQGTAGMPLALVVDGANFVDGMTVLWDGSPLATTYGSDTELSAMIASPAAGTYEVTVIGVDSAEITSAPLLVTINNPQPTISGLSPSSAIQNSPNPVTVSIMGSGFVAGATALWDGVEVALTVIDSENATVVIPASELAIGRTVGLSVQNPAPTSGAADEVAFQITNVPLAVQFQSSIESSTQWTTTAVLLAGVLAIGSFWMVKRNRID